MSLLLRHEFLSMTKQVGGFVCQLLNSKSRKRNGLGSSHEYSTIIVLVAMASATSAVGDKTSV